MKKLFGAIIVGTMVFGAVMASASALPTAGGSPLQASSLIDVSCQTTPVKITYTTELSGTGVNQVQSVTLHDIQASCVGAQASVQFIQGQPPYSGLGGPGHAVWYQWGPIAAAGNLTFTFAGTFPDAFGNTSKPPVADVDKINVLFSAQ